LPDNVTYVEKEPFSDCRMPKESSLLDAINTRVFANCSSLKKFIVDERNEHFSIDSTGKMLLSKDGSYLVAYPSASGTISLPDSITHIGDNVFCNSELKEISIPHSVVYIGDIAFAECNSLKEVSIPNSVTHIGDGAFFGTCNLSEITIPNSINYIGNETFSACNSLTTLSLPESITHIGEKAFAGCRSLKELSIPNSVTHIGKGAFGGNNLQEILIPNSVIEIGDGALSTWGKETQFIVDENNEHFSTDSTGKMLLSKDGSSLLSYPSAAGSVSLPDSITHIKAYAFSKCTSLQEIFIPASVTHIGEEAFSYCKALQNVSIPDSVIHIGKNAFAWCRSLKSVFFKNKKSQWRIYVAQKINVKNPSTAAWSLTNSCHEWNRC
ncbi:MAG: leucine-rich repeat protein, partial [Spirochaetaceae bacterium]|nr:leucine-rich repeat protein [Spirochaetaceae bacterium]